MSIFNYDHAINKMIHRLKLVNGLHIYRIYMYIYMVYTCDSEQPFTLRTGSRLLRVMEVEGHKFATCSFTDMNNSCSIGISQILISNDLLVYSLIWPQGYKT